MDQTLIDAVIKCAAQNMARDLASTTRATAEEISQRYIIEAYRSLQTGGAAYQQGQVAFADIYVRTIIEQYEAAIAASLAANLA